MIKLFFDIETLPEDESLTVDGEKIQKRSLKPELGKILCIGYIKETGEGMSQELIRGNESQILEEFWHVAKDADLFIGHGIFRFDLRFIAYRSNIHGVKPTQALSLSSYQGERIYDTMVEWEKKTGESFVSLERLAEKLGIESPKRKLRGEFVYAYHKADKDEEIYDYCVGDVEATRKIYNRINFME